MTPASPRPPTLSRRLLEWAAGRLGTPELADDALDLFVQKSRREGVRAARRWYRRQALAALRPLLFSRRAAAPSRRPPTQAPLPRRGTSHVSLLDFKLGLRMLVKHPGLTVVAGGAMAFAIAVGAGAFEFLTDAMYPTLPLEDGDRVVRLHVVDDRVGGRIGVAPADFAAWQGELRSVRELGAFHRVARALRVAEGAVVPVDGVAVSASAFDVARVTPVHGRPLVTGDAAPGAPPVAVLGYDLWRSRFASDPGVVGRVVRLGDEQVTVAGVMPDEFSFPAPADIYLPLRLDDLVTRARDGGHVPGLIGFGRLAPGATVEGAAAELRTVGAGAAVADEPEAAGHLTPAVESFAYPVLSGDGITTNKVFAILAFFLVLLMVVVCGNVALLLFARAAAREEEITVRAALGGGRGRIVAQLFVEALVLAGVALAAGLWVASAGLQRAMSLIEANAGDSLPFWIGDTLSPSTVGWAVVLAVFGAAIAGVIPGLQVTGRNLHGSLQRAAGRGSVIRLGRLWTAIVVAQVALTVILLPAVFMVGKEVWEIRTQEPGVAEGELLVAELEGEGDPDAFRAAYRDLRQALAAEPWVRGVAVSDWAWPGWYWNRPLEVDGLPSPSDRFDRTSKHMAVGPDFFRVMGTELVAGRFLTAEDVEADPPVAVVDEGFVDRILGGRNAVGRRIRIGGLQAAGEETTTDDTPEPWHEIVGVVADLGLNPYMRERYRGVIYRPLSTGAATDLSLTVRVTGEPAGFVTRLRVLALGAGPTLRLREPQPFDYRRDEPVREYGAWFRVWATGGAIALILSLAGIYAVMAFTVSRRTREIGVRVALGGRPPHVAVAILSHALRQVGYGVLAGGLVLPLLMIGITKLVESPPFPPPLTSAALLSAYLVVMTGVCLLACVVPMRRALRVEPTEALTAEG